MERTLKYANLKERQTIIDQQEGQGLVMLHDNFDPKWKRGNEPFGFLIFTNEPKPPPPLLPKRDLYAEIDKLKAEVKALTDIAKVNGVA